MDEHHAGAFLVSGVRRDDTPVGPLYATSADAHDVARKAITGVGGAVRILRDGDAGWVEVARYTDTGRHPTGTGMVIDWAVVDDPDEAPFEFPRAPRMRRWWSVRTG